MNRNLERILIFLGFAVPFVAVYKTLFSGGPLAWGDAPFFAPENLKELFNSPFLWNFRNDNFGAPQYYIIWLYLPTFLYGVLNHFLSLGNDFLIRIIFYFPATILAILGSWLFIGRFNRNTQAKFLGSFLYGFNTYFLMLIDGGQVGVALAYGLFPLTSLTLLNYLENLTVKNFLYALISFFALVGVDIRIALILILFAGFGWVIGKMDMLRKNWSNVFKGIIFLGLSLAGICAFWVIPVLSGNWFGSFGESGVLSSGTNFIKLTNSLFLFQPHFPLNQFGKIVETPFYFTFFLPVMFGSLILLSRFKNPFEKKIILKFSLVFLFFAFLAKGGSEPLGTLYLWLVSLPGGVVFRDSSKFYIPLILTGSLLVSFTLSSIKKFFSVKIFWGSLILFYGYLLFLIYPAISGNLTGVLGKHSDNINYQLISREIQKENGFLRSLWVEEKPAQFYGSWEKPALSANTLYKDRPFASMMTGKYDLFNYFNSPQICQWLNLLGVKYVFLPPNERKKIVNDEEEKYRDNLISLVAGNTCLKSLNVGISFPAYQNVSNMPQIFAQKKIFLVVGGEDIYDKLIVNQNFSLAKQGFVFLEQGQTDLRSLPVADSGSINILFNQKELLDLQMGYLQDKMISPFASSKNQWSIYGSGDYLAWKYEFLKHNINMKEFDFGRGVAMSSVPGEKMKFKISVPEQGNYFLAVRYLMALGSSMNINVSGKKINLPQSPLSQFKWGVVGPFRAEGKVLDVEIENTGSFSSLNTMALISEAEFQKSRDLADSLVNRFQTIYINQDSDWGQVTNLLDNSFSPVQYQRINPTQYKITNLPSSPVWLVFSDHYNSGWVVKESNSVLHLPFYAMINGFYLDGKKNGLILFYSPQDKTPFATTFSFVSLGIITLTVSILLWKNKKFKI